MAGLFLNSGMLIGFARNARDRALNGAEHENVVRAEPALTAIIFAAASGEAFINEIGELASHKQPPGHPVADVVQNMATLLGDAEDSRSTTNHKYLLGKLALTGKAYQKGTSPFQDFALLMDVRNSLMHIKFDRIESVAAGGVSVKHPRVFDKLPPAVLAKFPDDENTIAGWVTRIGTPAMATWACSATTSIVRDIVESIPEGYFRGNVDVCFREFFQ